MRLFKVLKAITQPPATLARAGDVLTEEQLLAHGIERLLGLEAIAPHEEAESAEPTLEEMTRKELDELALDLGVTGAREAKNKAEVIAAIREAQAMPEVGADGVGVL
jgi:hypothetical protein